jgi:hypothetical protein
LKNFFAERFTKKPVGEGEFEDLYKDDPKLEMLSAEIFGHMQDKEDKKW